MFGWLFRKKEKETTSDDLGMELFKQMVCLAHEQVSQTHRLREVITDTRILLQDYMKAQHKLAYALENPPETVRELKGLVDKMVRIFCSSTTTVGGGNAQGFGDIVENLSKKVMHLANRFETFMDKTGITNKENCR